MFHVPMVPANMDFIVGNAHHGGPTGAGCVSLLFLYSRRTVWVYLVSLAFALSVWMRQAAIFELGMLLLALLAAVSPSAVVGILRARRCADSGYRLVQAPLSTIATLGHDDGSPTMSWSLALFALEVARPDDVVDARCNGGPLFQRGTRGEAKTPRSAQRRLRPGLESLRSEHVSRGPSCRRAYCWQRRHELRGGRSPLRVCRAGLQSARDQVDTNLVWDRSGMPSRT